MEWPTQLMAAERACSTVVPRLYDIWRPNGPLQCVTLTIRSQHQEKDDIIKPPRP